MIIVRTVRALHFTREERVAMLAAFLLLVVPIIVGASVNLSTTGQIGGGAPAVAPIATVTPVPAPPAPMVAIPADEVSEGFRTALLAAGYRGIPGDDAEAILAPRDVAVSLCATDADCEWAAGERFVVDGPVRSL